MRSYRSADFVRGGGAVRAGGARRHFWKGWHASRRPGRTGRGFAVWFYTLLLPAFARSEWLPIGFLEHGPARHRAPQAGGALRLSGLDQITHAMIWSMLANVGAYIGFSLMHAPSAEEHRQASLFVDVFKRPAEAGESRFWRGSASAPSCSTCWRASSAWGGR
jgi:hypothetical protein